MGMLSERQTARSLVRIGKRVKLKAEVDVSPLGLLAVTVLVCSVLLSTSVLVAKAIGTPRG